MKHLKTFENFEDFGRFSDEEDQLLNPQEPEDVENVEDQNCKSCDDSDEENDDMTEEEKREEEDGIVNWGDQVVEGFYSFNEKKKTNPGFQAYLDKQKAKNKGKDEKECKGSKCKCADDKCKDKKEPKKGLTASQKKLPEHLQKSILKKQGK